MFYNEDAKDTKPKVSNDGPHMFAQYIYYLIGCTIQGIIIPRDDGPRIFVQWMYVPLILIHNWI